MLNNRECINHRKIRIARHEREIIWKYVFFHSESSAVSSAKFAETIKAERDFDALGT